METYTICNKRFERAEEKCKNWQKPNKCLRQFQSLFVVEQNKWNVSSFFRRIFFESSSNVLP